MCLCVCVYVIDTTYFDECFSVHLISKKHYFLYEFIGTVSFLFSTALLLRSLKQGSPYFKFVTYAATVQC